MDAKAKYLLSKIAVMVALISALTLIGCKQSEPGSDRSSKSVDPSVAAQDDAKEAQQPTAPASGAAPADVFGQYKCAGQDCQGPFMATNEKEAFWLRANGYPTQQQREDSRALSAAQLKQRADQGDLAYQALYGEKLAQEGQGRQGLGALGDAVSRGSLYALYSISDVYANDRELKNPMLSKAYLRLAFLAGDSKATYVLSQRFPDFNTPPEMVAIDKRASELHRSLLKNQSRPRPM